MNDEMKAKQGQKVYETICAMFDDLGYHYQKHEEQLAITCTVHGEDIPMEMIIIVRADRRIVSLSSPMPFKVPEDKRIDMALAVHVANYGMVDGSFDYNISNGEITFRLTACYIESILSKDLFEYMLMVSASTVDSYNDKFLMLSKGVLTLEQFIESDQ